MRGGRVSSRAYRRRYVAFASVVWHKGPVARGLVSNRDVARQSRKQLLEPLDDGRGSPDQPDERETNRGKDEWKRQRQENSQRHIGEQGQGPVSLRRPWPRHVDD